VKKEEKSDEKGRKEAERAEKSRIHGKTLLCFERRTAEKESERAETRRNGEKEEQNWP